MSDQYLNNLAVFGFALLQSLIVCVFSGFLFTVGLRGLIKAWPTKKLLNIWAFSSLLFAGVYVLLIPISLNMLWLDIPKIVVVNGIAGFAMTRIRKGGEKAFDQKNFFLTWLYLFVLGFILYSLIRGIS